MPLDSQVAKIILHSLEERQQGCRSDCVMLAEKSHGPRYSPHNHLTPPQKSIINPWNSLLENVIGKSAGFKASYIWRWASLQFHLQLSETRSYKISGFRVQIKQQGKGETPVCKLYHAYDRHLMPSPKTRGNRYFWWQASRIAEQLVCSIGTNALLHV